MNDETRFGQVSDDQLDDIIAENAERNTEFMKLYFDNNEFQKAIKEAARKRAYRIITPEKQVLDLLPVYLLGPLAGGFLAAAAGIPWAFGVDALSFAISAACLAAMHRTEPPASTSPPLWQGISEGLRYARSQPWLWWSMIGNGIGNVACFIPLLLLEPLLVREVFHAGPIALGMMYAASGVGGVLAAVYAGRRHPPRRPITTIWITICCAGLCVIVIGLSSWLWLAVTVAGIAWCAITYADVLWHPLMQQQVPSGLLGRVSALDWMVSLGLTPAGTVVGGGVASLIGVRLTFILGGSIGAASAGVLFLPGVTALDRQQQAESSAVPAAQ
jgi:hypothetical protein